MLKLDNLTTNFVKNTFLQNNQTYSNLNTKTQLKNDTFEKNNDKINFGKKDPEEDRLLQCAREIFGLPPITSEEEQSGRYNVRENNKIQNQVQQEYSVWKDNLVKAAYGDPDMPFAFTPDKLAAAILKFKLSTSIDNSNGINLRRSLFPFIVDLIQKEITYSKQDFSEVLDYFTLLYGNCASRPGKNNRNLPIYINQLQDILEHFPIKEDDLGISSDIAKKLKDIISNMSYYRGDRY